MKHYRVYMIVGVLVPLGFFVLVARAWHAEQREIAGSVTSPCHGYRVRGYSGTDRVSLCVEVSP